MLIVTLFLVQVDVDAQKMSGTWHAVPLKRVNSHSNAIDIQADEVHQRMPNLSYSVERG